MSDAVQAGERLLDLDPARAITDDEAQMFFLAMVVAYARPFTANDGIGAVWQDYQDPASCPEFFNDPDMHRQHEQLMTLRNNFMSHSSVVGTKVKVYPPGYAPANGAPPVSDFLFAPGKQRFADPRFVHSLLGLPRAFRDRLDKDIKALLLAVDPHHAKAKHAWPLTIEPDVKPFVWRIPAPTTWVPYQERKKKNWGTRFMAKFGLKRC